MPLPQNQTSRRYTWNDYQGWPDDERWELIHGEAFAMSPSPTSRHQSIAAELVSALSHSLRGKSCRVFIAPLDVKLAEDTVVQPDLVVVCDPHQIQRTHIAGAPKLVVEILSTSTWRHDRMRKLNLYAQVGVAEFWLVTPHPGLVEVLELRDGRYTIAGTFLPEDTLTSPTFPELRLALPNVFDFPIEPDEQIDMVKESSPPYDIAAADAR